MSLFILRLPVALGVFTNTGKQTVKRECRVRLVFARLKHFALCITVILRITTFYLYCSRTRASVDVTSLAYSIGLTGDKAGDTATRKDRRPAAVVERLTVLCRTGCLATS